MAEAWVYDDIPPPADMRRLPDFVKQSRALMLEHIHYIRELVAWRASQAALETLAFPVAAMEDDRGKVGLMKVKADLLKTAIESGRPDGQAVPGAVGGQTVINFIEAKRD
jgi:hypothetical protein